MMNGKKPSVAELGQDLQSLEKELRNEKRRSNYNKALRSTLYSLMVVAAVAILVATLVMPVLHISGSSMTPLIGDGEICAVFRSDDLERGDIIAFYYNNKILIKRVIAFPGERVEIDSQGNVKIDGQILAEPYLTEKAMGDVSIDWPHQVGESKLFVLGDHRSTSADSRSALIGDIPLDDVIGKVFLRVWPLNRIGLIN